MVSEKPSENINYIVVPDGVAADADGKPIRSPSFVYKQVLDYVLSIASDKDFIYLAPANDFGCGRYEHELAFDYLKERNKDLNLICPKVESNKYIDTYGNAIYLKSYLKEKINASFELICSALHSYRAEYCFKKTGYRISRIHRVEYAIMNENIIRRFWYYKCKAVHVLYELLAMTRDVVRLR